MPLNQTWPSAISGTSSSDALVGVIPPDAKTEEERVADLLTLMDTWLGEMKVLSQR